VRRSLAGKSKRRARIHASEPERGEEGKGGKIGSSKRKVGKGMGKGGKVGIA